MRHKIVDLSSSLNSLYMRLDLFPKKVIINQMSKRLINNCELLIKQISSMRQKDKYDDLDQEESADLFKETFEISLMARASPLTCEIPKVGITFGVLFSLIVGQYFKLDQASD